MLHRGSWCVTLVVVVVGAAFGFPPLRATDFETGAGDVLLRRCLECHGATDPSGGLDLSRVDGLRAGGDSGAVVVPADPAASLLLSRVIAGEMPPPKNGHAWRSRLVGLRAAPHRAAAGRAGYQSPDRRLRP
jgi:hypothetical protein